MEDCRLDGHTDHGSDPPGRRSRGVREPNQPDPAHGGASPSLWHTLGRTRGYLSATTLFAAFATLTACDTSQRSAGPCDDYRDDPMVQGACWVDQAGLSTAGSTADAVCGQAGPLEPDCRRTWVTTRSAPTSGWETEDLLMACRASNARDSADCALAVLDARPSQVVEEQLRLCETWTGAIAEDCAIHTLERWWKDSPSGPGVDAMMRLTRFPQIRGRYGGTVIACSGRGTCSGTEETRGACREAVKAVSERPSICASAGEDTISIPR